MIKVKSWQLIKGFSDERSAPITYFDDGGFYYIYSFDGPITVFYEMDKSPSVTTDLDDFENNYKLSANQRHGNLTFDNSYVKLRVDSNYTSIANGVFDKLSSKLRIEDMNVANGGVARLSSITNASWVDIYSYSGTGTLHGFLVNTELKTGWRIRLVVDSEEIFGSSGILIDDLVDNDVWDINHFNSEKHDALGIYMANHDRFIFNGISGKGIGFSASVSIKLKRDTGENSKKFRAGMVSISKES